MSDTAHQSQDAEPASMSREWHYHPNLPVTYAPYWDWPPKPMKLLKWLWNTYLQFSDRAIYLALAFMVAFWLQPVGSDQTSFGFGWVTRVVLRNYLAVIAVAGGLHWWLYIRKGQGSRFKYDPRPILPRKNALYKFDYQLRDNIFYALAYGVPIMSGFEIGMRMAFANGWVAPLNFWDHPVYFVLLFPALAVWQSFHFYVIHRAIHWPPLYRHVHSIHHRNVNTTSWSGMSMHPLEQFLYIGAVLILLVVPAHPVHLMFLLYWLVLGAISSHAGYETLFVKNKERLDIGSFFHQLHHRYYECNYGNSEMPWDKWFGTYHDGSEDATRATRDRKRKMHAQ